MGARRGARGRGLLAFDVMRLRRGLGLVALACFGALAIWSGLSVLWAWLPGDATAEASRALFYAAAFAIVLLAVRTQRDAATMVGLIAAATGLVTLYGCVRLAQSPSEAYMIYGRLGWPTGYPNTSASFGVLGFWTLVGIGAERALAWPLRSLALGAAVPALGFALLTQSRGAAFTLVLVAPFAIALVRERLRLTAFLLVALAGLLPAVPALRTAIDSGSAAAAGSAAIASCSGRLRRRAAGGGDRGGRSAHLSLDPATPLDRPRRGRGDRRRGGSDRRSGAAAERARARPQHVALLHAGRRRGVSGPHLLSADSNRWDFWQVAARDLPPGR